MNKALIFSALIVAVLPTVQASAATTVPGQLNHQPASFIFKDAAGKTASVPVIQKYQPKKILFPFGRNTQGRIDPRLMRAATIAEDRAHAHSRRQCWHAVKEALVASGVIDSRPKTVLAKQAAQELVSNYGFKRLPVTDPYQAPIGSVLVYDARRAAGHIEMRTQNGFVSDFRSNTPSRRPLIGVFVKS
jgi:hypothetical protein